MSMTNADEVAAAVERLTSLVAVAITRDMDQADAIALLSPGSLSNNQIAAILGTTPDTVRATLSRIRRSPPARKVTRGGAVTG